MSLRRPSSDPGFSTEELTRVYGPERTVGAILEFEAGLAASLVEVGITPSGEAEALIRACGDGVSDPAAVLASTWSAGTPILALRGEVTAGLSVDEGRWFHFGATTQDAIDTAQMLQAREALGHIDDMLLGLARALRHRTIEWREQAQIGRTFLQDAEPTVFGLRTAGWLDSTLGHILELRLSRDLLAVQLAGSVGTLDAYGEKGGVLRTTLASRLDLADPGIGWHADRGRVLSVAHALERTARSMAKVATDIALLTSTAIGEMSVRPGGSSSMPDKRNPIDSVRAVAAAAACTGAVAMLTAGPPIELDRGVGGWHVEWVAVPLVFQTAGASVEAVATAIGSIDLHTAAMENDVETLTGTGAQTQIDTVLEKANSLL